MRTEEQVFKNFEKLGYKIKYNTDSRLYMRKDNGITISIWKLDNSQTIEQGYRKYDYEEDYLALMVNVEEHKLLNELFTIWGWL